MFYKNIISDSEPVDMGDAKSGHPGPFTVSATGRAWWEWSDCLGDFTLTKEQHNDRPVYRNSEGWLLYSKDDNLYSLELGSGGPIGYSQPVYRSTTPAPSPVLCQNWEYLDLDDDYMKYKPGNIKVKVAI